MKRHPSKGWGPWRCEWWSICSRHYVYEPTCSLCNAGEWQNMTLHRIDRLVWRCRPLALWWHNRPNSKARQTLRRLFSNL